MKTIPAIAATLWLLTLSSLAMATTLKLRPDIELMMVDGKKVSGSLLNGADSLELEKGYHQIVFQALRTVGSATGAKQTYRSPGLIAVFDAHNLNEVSIRLPDLESPSAQRDFSQSPDYQLVDSKNQPIPSRTDVLRAGEAELSGEIEKRMAEYNRSSQPAAVITFARQSPTKASATTNAPANPLDPLGIMQYWFQQADKGTRQRFLEWAREREAQ